MPEINFQFYEVYADMHVIGRNCGGDLPVGTVFTAIVRKTFPRRFAGNETSDQPTEFVAPVALRLERVEAYRQELGVLSSGMTAKLRLSGSGFELLAELLDQAPKQTYYSLVVDASKGNRPGLIA